METEPTTNTVEEVQRQPTAADAITALSWLFFEFAVIPSVIFITQKLCGAISWEWKWVLSPLWIMAATFVVGFLSGLAFEVLHRAKREH